MGDLPVFEAGNYRHIKAVLQYCGGVAGKPLPLAVGKVLAAREIVI